jgi:hypothetical protein
MRRASSVGLSKMENKDIEEEGTVAVSIVLSDFGIKEWRA